MDTLDSTSLNNGSSTVNLGGDLGPLGAASPSTQASWDQAAAEAGLDWGGGTDDGGWGGAGNGVPTLAVRAPAAGDGLAAPGNSVADAAGHAGTAPGTAGADTDKSFWQKAEDFLTDPHTVLGAASFAPSVFGSAASAADGLLYGLQGKYTDAGLSLGAAAVGMVSDAGAARLAAEGIKVGAEALTAGRAGEAVAHAVEAERVGQATDTVAHAAEGTTEVDKGLQATSATTIVPTGQTHPSPGDAFPNRALPRSEHGTPIPDAEAAGTAHTQLGRQEGRNGSYPQAWEFDQNGKPVRDIDFTDHGRPQNHVNPHQHRYIPNPTGGSPQHGPMEPLK